jgi:hypothetical protein
LPSLVRYLEEHFDDEVDKVVIPVQEEMTRLYALLQQVGNKNKMSHKTYPTSTAVLIIGAIPGGDDKALRAPPAGGE